LTSDIVWKFGASDTERAERIEAGELRCGSVDEDEDLGDVLGHVLPRLLSQVAVEHFVATRECGSVMILPKRLELKRRD